MTYLSYKKIIKFWLYTFSATSFDWFNKMNSCWWKFIWHEILCNFRPSVNITICVIWSLLRIHSHSGALFLLAIWIIFHCLILLHLCLQPPIHLCCLYNFQTACNFVCCLFILFNYCFINNKDTHLQYFLTGHSFLEVLLKFCSINKYKKSITM